VETQKYNVNMEIASLWLDFYRSPCPHLYEAIHGQGVNVKALPNCFIAGW